MCGAGTSSSCASSPTAIRNCACCSSSRHEIQPTTSCGDAGRHCAVVASSPCSTGRRSSGSGRSSPARGASERGWTAHSPSRCGAPRPAPRSPPPRCGSTTRSWRSSRRRAGWPVLYDVTDDWLASSMSARARARLRAFEEQLLRDADSVVVCSSDLERSKGATRPLHLIPNAVDREHLDTPRPRPQDLPASPVAVYVGTLHEDRLDVDLVVRTATEIPEVRFAFVGPNALSPASAARLRARSRTCASSARDRTTRCPPTSSTRT